MGLFIDLITAIPVAAVLALIWFHTVLYRWDGGGKKVDGWILGWGVYFFGLLITFVWISKDRKHRGLYDLIEGWGIDRWVLVIGIVLVSLVFVGGLRIYAGKKDKTLVE